MSVSDAAVDMLAQMLLDEDQPRGERVCKAQTEKAAVPEAEAKVG